MPIEIPKRAFTLLLFSHAVFAATVPFKVEKSKVDYSIVMSGIVEPLETASVQTKSYTFIKQFHVSPGVQVKKGDLIAESDLQYYDGSKRYYIESMTILESNLKNAAIDQEYLRAKQKRVEMLAQKDIVPRKQLEELDLQLLQSEVRKRQAEASLKQMETELEKIDNLIRAANFYAPIDGTVTEMAVNPKQITGSYGANPGTVLARIERPGKYKLLAYATDTQIQDLKLGSSGLVVFDASQETYPGKIIEIRRSDALDKGNLSLFLVTFLFEKTGEMLHRSVLARLEFLPEIEPTVNVPWNTIRTEGQGTHVRVLNEKNGWEDRKVQLGLRGKNRVEVSSGLKQGDVVEATLW